MFPIDFQRAATGGLAEKALELTQAASRAGFDVTMAYAEGGSVCIWDARARPHAPPAVRATSSSALARLRTLVTFWGELESYLDTLRIPPRVVWVRTAPATPGQLRFLRSAKRRGARIVVDVPTVAQRSELRGARAIALRGLATWQREAYALADRIATVSEHTELWGRPTVRVVNGVAAVSGLRGVERRPGDEVRVVGFGQWAYWHGVDRFLEAWAAAACRARVSLQLHGGGAALPGLRARARRLGLELVCRASTFGEDRSRVLAEADLGLGALNGRRKGLATLSGLKHRTYAAHGLPYLVSDLDHDLRGRLGAYAVPDDENPVDLDRAVAWLDDLRAHPGYRARVALAVGDLSWDKTYAALWDYFAAVSA